MFAAIRFNMEYILKLLNVSLFASIKYFWSTPYAFILNLNLLETFLSIEIGGIIGFLLYYYFFRFLLKEIAILWPKVYNITPPLFKVRFELWLTRRRQKMLTRRKFTHMNKFIVRIRRSYGMWGIIVLSPIILSIPIGALLGTKYFAHRQSFIPYMILSISVWGVISVALFGALMGH
jgi:hypothetical protein